MKLLNEIYERQQVTAPDGSILHLHSHLSPEAGEFIYNLIRNDQDVERTLEVGCAYGLSSLQICSALNGREGAKHTIIDPFQNTQWQSVGISNLHREGLNCFELIEERSEFALPRIAADHASQFDLIFVDGWHTFDHTLIDCFYATRLLRVGGYLLIDDARWFSVSKAIRYLENYPCYERHGSVRCDPAESRWEARAARTLFSIPPLSLALSYLPHTVRVLLSDSDQNSLVALRKRAEDSRSWDWYVDF
jgi:predicted O-methyltransferase YrrM